MTSIPVRTLQDHRRLRKGIRYYSRHSRIFYKVSDVIDYLENNPIDPAA